MIAALQSAADDQLQPFFCLLVAQEPDELERDLSDLRIVGKSRNVSGNRFQKIPAGKGLMKEKQFSVASLMTPRGERRIFVSGHPEKFVVRRGLLVPVKGRTGQTRVAVQNFPHFENGRARFVFDEDGFEPLFRFEDLIVAERELAGTARARHTFREMFSQ